MRRWMGGGEGLRGMKMVEGGCWGGDSWKWLVLLCRIDGRSWEGR